MDRSTFLNFNAFLSFKIVFILANSANSDVMPDKAAFHQGLHCLQNYLLTSIQNEKGLNKTPTSGGSRRGSDEPPPRPPFLMKWDI